MLIQANADMRSWAMIAALNGTESMFRTRTPSEQCSTKRAASIRGAGITIFAFRNHAPAVSTSSTSSRESRSCTAIPVANTCRSLPESERPISKAR